MANIKWKLVKKDKSKNPTLIPISLPVWDIEGSEEIVEAAFHCPWLQHNDTKDVAENTNQAQQNS